MTLAISTLGSDLHASIAAVQWVLTGYLLAFATVIRLGCWAAGPRRMGRVMSVIGVPMLLLATAVVPALLLPSATRGREAAEVSDGGV
jgi:hypothetical protein